MARPGYFKKTFTIDGKQYTAYGHTHDEAVAKAAIKRAEIEGKIKTQKTARNNYTVEKWSKEWLEKHKKGTTGEAWYKSSARSVLLQMFLIFTIKSVGSAFPFDSSHSLMHDSIERNPTLSPYIRDVCRYAFVGII